MRSILIFCLIFPQLSYANDFCDAVFDIAKSTMKLRQSGATIKEQEKLLITYGEKSETYRLIKKIVLYDAYKIPKFEKDSEKKEITEAFAESNYLACMKSDK
ncbi:hypothetical protein [Acinetobacter bereziniae]|uniref:hypothetical protein n=1 Tax=Acinetobacter bereziniae TaxID=106648 RepID=UPI0006690371|nr:hypothetical protein [Acinetobacter bereziniae]